MRSHYLFLFFILSSFHSLYLSPHCLSISSFFLQTFSPSPISQAQPPTLFSITDLTSPTATDHSLHCRSHKPRRRPFSPLPNSQAQPPQTLLSIADLTSPAATNPSVSLCTHSVSIEKDQATPLASKSGGQYQLGLNSSMKTMKLCPLAQVLSVGTKTDRVSGMGRGCPPVCVGSGCAMFCGIGFALVSG